jgi:uncharacterized protein YbaP (TraB family)
MKQNQIKQLAGTVVGLVLWLLLSASSQAATSVWEISKGDQRLYIGGTIHILAKADWPIPRAYDRAYTRASVVVFETDLGAMNTPEVGRRMMQALQYQPPMSLESVLDKPTYAAVKQFFEQRGVPMEKVNRFKPGMVSMMMSMMELERLDQAGEGVDAYYYARARQDHKVVGKLEDVEAQIRFIAEMGQGQENELLRQTMDEAKELPAIMSEMKKAWRNGDADAIDRLMITSMREQTPQVYRSLLVERNRAWLPKIEAMLNTREVEFVMVGAAHLVGEDGLIAQLVRLGYRVRQLD